MRIAREVALYKQDSVENGIDEASQVATSFITYVSQAEGIKVHNADDMRDYIKVNSNGIDLVDNNVSVAEFSTTTRVGKASAANVQIDDTSVKIQESANNYTNVTSGGLEVYQGGAQVASFGSTARIGATSGYNVYVDNNGIDLREGTSDRFQIYSEPYGGETASYIKAETAYSNSQYISYVDPTSSGHSTSRIEASGATDRTASVTASRYSNSATAQIRAYYSGDSNASISLSCNELVSSINAYTTGEIFIQAVDTKVTGKLYAQGTLVRLLKVTKSSVSSLSTTITNSLITSNMEVVHSVLSNPSAQTGDWTVTTSDGSLTITGSISGTTNITLYLAEPST